MNWFLGASPKIIVIAVMVVIILQKWRTGYFRGLSFKRLLWNVPTFYRLTPFILLAAGLFVLDPILLAWVRGNPNSLTAFIADFGGKIGRNVHPWTLLAVVYLFGLVIRKPFLSNGAMSGLLSGLLAAIYSFVFKFVFLRARPYGNAGHLSFFNLDGLLEDSRRFQSFPSGDVAVVAGMSFYFFFKIKNKILRWLLVFLPLSTGFSRVYANKHWPSDTIMAMGLGLMAAYGLLQHEKSKTEKID